METAGSATVLKSILREKTLVGGLVVSLALQAAIAVVEPWPLQVVFDCVIGRSPLPVWLSPWQERLSAEPRHGLLFTMVLALIAFAAATGTALYLQNQLLTRLNQTVVQKLRVTFFAHVVQLPITFFHRMGPGEIISRLTADTADLQPLIEGALILMFRSIPTFLGIFALMVWIDPPFALLVAAAAPILAFGTVYFGKRVKQATRRQRSYEADVAAVTEVATRTQKCLKILGLCEQATRRLEERCLQSLEAAVEAGSWQGGYTATVHTTLAGGIAAVLLVGVYRIEAGRISAGELLVFMSYLRSLYKPVKELAKYFNKISKGLACKERIEDVLALTPCQLGVCGDTEDAVPMPAFRQAIRFECVAFAYEPNLPVLEDITFTVRKGQKIGIVGDSGSGKSTLLNLVPRFLDPIEGRIFIDDRDIRTFTLESLRSQVAIVPQEHIIFPATVLENIALGRPESPASRDEILRAAKEANAHSFIARLPQGYDTLLGPSGTELSIGQAKRIHIARALLRNAPIILLDEPTAGLDPSSESKVMEAFDRLMRRGTLFVVTHYLPLIANADAILVLERGRIVQQGRHDDLVREGRYAELWADFMRHLG